ncbi:MAG: hypothetical protein INQ03_22220 [Candidatus Heimdallarchaeota archaeon]|nr:hypothetical protein [Candidatus Heimdallarchaeota archaeon]
MDVVIAIDLDETIIDIFEALSDFANSRYKTKFSKEDYTEYSIYNILPITKAESFILVQEFYKTEEFLQLIPNKDAIEYIPKIKSLSDSITIDIVTSRAGDHVIENTNKMLSKYFPNCIRNVHFGSQHEIVDKGDILKSINAKVFVDDHLKHIKSASSICEYVFLINQPWNTSEREEKKYFPDGLPDNVTRIDDFSQLYSILKNSID